MNNPSVAAKFRDAARAHFCEELYKVPLSTVVADPSFPGVVVVAAIHTRKGWE